MKNLISVWKIVRKGHSISPWISKYDAALEYTVNETIKPEIGKLFCFDTEENALSFFKQNYGSRGYKGIFKLMTGYGLNPVRMKKGIDFSRCLEGSYESGKFIKPVNGDIKTVLKKFWKFKKSKKKPFDDFYLFPLPKGTVCVDSFTPTESRKLDQE